jgi:RNA recognition motif-containing protein
LAGRAILPLEANMKLWIGNIEPGTTDDEIREFVKKYAPDLEITVIQRLDGDGSRPAAQLEFKDTPYGSVEKISMRLHGMHWKGRELYVQTMAR